MQVTLGLAAPVFHGRVQPELDTLLTAAAGAGFTVPIGTNYYERPIALSFLLTTSNQAATRQVQLQLLDPFGVVVAAEPVASTQTASLAYTYSFLAQLATPSAVASLVVISPLFDFVIPSDYELSVGIVNVQTNDQISAIRYYRDRFSTGPDGYPIGGVDLDPYESEVAAERALVK